MRWFKWPAASEILALLFLVMAGWKFTYGLENRHDINLHDPTFYLYNGINLENNGLPEAEDAPLYAIWFYLLSFTESDSIELYYRDYKLWTILLPVFVFIVLRRLKVPVQISMVTAAFLLMSFLNYPSFSRVSHAATCVVLASLWMVDGCRENKTWAYAWAMLGALFASYIRPELFLAFLIFTALYIIGRLKTLKLKAWKVEMGQMGLVLGGVFIVLAFIGFPVGGERGMVAFKEHFSANWVGWMQSGMDSWTQADAIFQSVFGDAESMFSVFVSAPSAFFHHMLTNLAALPVNLVYLMSLHTIPVATGWLVLICLVVGVIAVYRTGLGASLKIYRRHPSITLCILVYLLTSLVSILVIHPRLHYLVLPGVLLFIGLVSILAFSEEEPRLLPRTIITIGLLIVMLMPTPSWSVQRDHVRLIEYFSHRGIRDPVNLLHEGGLWRPYLGDNFEDCYAGWKNGSVDDFLLSKGINVILVSQRLLADERLNSDPEWKRFLLYPEEKAFVRMDVPGMNDYLLIHSSLLKSEGELRD